MVYSFSLFFDSRILHLFIFSFDHGLQVDNSALTGESMPEPRHNKTEPVGKPGKTGKGWFIRPDAQRPDKKQNGMSSASRASSRHSTGHPV